MVKPFPRAGKRAEAHVKMPHTILNFKHQAQHKMAKLAIYFIDKKGKKMAMRMDKDIFGIVLDGEPLLGNEVQEPDLPF